MARLTAEQLIKAHALQHWNTLWLAAEPLVKFAMAELGCGDDDAWQTGRLAAGGAIRTWNPARGAFSTHIATQVRGALLKWLNEQRTGGVGSRRQTEENNAPEMISLNDAADVPTNYEVNDEDVDRGDPAAKLVGRLHLDHA